MTAQTIVMLVAAAPVLAAVVCRLNEFDYRSMPILSAVITWLVGCAVVGALLFLPGPIFWAVVAAGWLWILGTWAFRPVPQQVKR